MSTIYLVSKGDYSDYRICGVYSSKEKAERAKEIFDAGIEEFEIDAVPECPPGLFPWHVSMKRDGSVDAAFRTEPSDMSTWVWATGHGFGTDVFAEDKKHAIKIANEWRIKALVTGLWDEWMRKWAETPSGRFPDWANEMGKHQ